MFSGTLTVGLGSCCTLRDALFSAMVLTYLSNFLCWKLDPQTSMLMIFEDGTFKKMIGRELSYEWISSVD